MESCTIWQIGTVLFMFLTVVLYVNLFKNKN